MSAKVIDEIYFNNQRAFLVFNEYFNSNKENIINAADANHKEVFYLPNFLNLSMCKFIRYGHHSIGKVLEMSKPHYYTKSVIK